MRQVYLCLLFCASASFLFAQSEDRYFEVGLKAGIVNYQGDLQKSLFTAAGSNALLGGFLRYSLNENFAVRGVLEGGTISADDADNSDLAARGFSFESNIVAGEIVVEYLPLGKERFQNGIYFSQINPYVFAGLGTALADAEVTTANPADAGLFPEAGDRSTFFTLPLGAGVRADVVSGIAVGLEANFRATFNDYLDGVSVNGRADRNDWFWTFGGYASFTFGNQDKKSMNF
ncbi:MAG: DUF6089 family protein [Saprospiraceae bacterium]